jgi:maleylpyruvate isomerase
MYTDCQDLLTQLDEIFATTLTRVPDAAFTQPSPLPGWTTAHVVAHVHFNANALSRLVGWARTSEPTQMYTSASQRSEEIHQGSQETPQVLRSLVAESAKRFSAEYAALTASQRDGIVVTAQGRHIPAAELAWLRCRELGVHAVDLCAGTTFEHLPTAFVELLTAEVLRKRLAGGEGPALAAWLTGRRPDTPLDRWL